MPSSLVERVGSEVVFRMHQFQCARTSKEKNVISLPCPLKVGNDTEALYRLFRRIVSAFRKGQTTVIINVGNKMLREAVDSKRKTFGSKRKTFGTHAVDFLCSDRTFRELSTQIGKHIKAYEGIKPDGSKTIEFYEIGSDYTVCKDDTCYICIKS